jgi:hypothetical protein
MAAIFLKARRWQARRRGSSKLILSTLSTILALPKV